MEYILSQSSFWWGRRRGPGRGRRCRVSCRENPGLSRSDPAPRPGTAGEFAYRDLASTELTCTGV